MMLETVREFALERLAESGEAAATEAAHAASILMWAERTEPALLGPDEQLWQARCDAELGNIRAALVWSLEHDVERALRIGAALWVYWSWYQVTEGRRWLAAALSRSTPTTGTIQARALTTHGALAVLAGDAAACGASASAAVILAREAGDVVAEAEARWIVACRHFYTDRVEPAAPELDAALTLFEQATTATDRSWAAYAQSHRGALALMLGDGNQSVACYEEALARARDAGSDGITLIILSDFAGWLIDLGETSRAHGLLEESLALAANHYGGAWLVASTMIGLALVAAVKGEAEIAARRIGAVEAVRTRSGVDIPIHYQHRLDRAKALAERALGAETFTTIWAAGRADPAAVIADALGRPSAATSATGGSDTADTVRLSPREREVLALLVAGRSDKEIAAALSISHRTVSHHVATILAKFGARSRAEAAVRAVRDGLI